MNKQIKEESGSGFLDILGAADFLGFSQAWVYHKARAKILPHIRIGRNYKFDPKKLKAWMDAHEVKGCLKV